MCPYGAGTFTTQTGSITIPADYEYNESITCEYVRTTGAPIYLRFDSFATEAIYDKVEVYNGTAANGTLKGRFSGATVPASQVATSGSMYVRFTSNSGTAATSDIPAGVSMTWLDTMPVGCAPNTTARRFHGCAARAPFGTDGLSAAVRPLHVADQPATARRPQERERRGALPGVLVHSPRPHRGMRCRAAQSRLDALSLLA